MIPYFSKFFDEANKGTHKHIGQFVAYVGELANREAFLIHLFSLSLIVPRSHGTLPCHLILLALEEN
jgi:hypothetical protein